MGPAEQPEARDYHIDHYVRVLRDTFATRPRRAFCPDDFAAVFADPDQLSLFTPPLAMMKPVLTTTLPTASAPSDEETD